jgi:hypothetical protein
MEEILLLPLKPSMCPLDDMGGWRSGDKYVEPLIKNL